MPRRPCRRSGSGCVPRNVWGDVGFPVLCVILLIRPFCFAANSALCIPRCSVVDKSPQSIAPCLGEEISAAPLIAQGNHPPITPLTPRVCHLHKSGIRRFFVVFFSCICSVFLFLFFFRDVFGAHAPHPPRERPPWRRCRTTSTCTALRSSLWPPTCTPPWPPRRWYGPCSTPP